VARARAAGASAAPSLLVDDFLEELLGVGDRLAFDLPGSPLLSFTLMGRSRSIPLAVVSGSASTL